MNPEQITSPEHKERYGENVEMAVYLVRHAEKQTSKDLSKTTGVDMLLTEKGIDDAKKFGEELKVKHPGFKGAKIYHSGIDRAKISGDFIAGEEASYIPRERDSLVLRGKLTQEAFNKAVEEAKQEGGGEPAMIQKLLDAEDVPIDEKSMTSKDISRVVASNIMKMVDMSKKLLSDSKVYVVLVSHAGMIEHFLVDLLKKERSGFMKDYLGELQYLEGPEFMIKRKNKEEITIEVKFRDESFTISEDQLRALAT